MRDELADKPGLLFKERVLEILLTIYSGENEGKEIYIQYIANKINSPHSYVWLVIKKLEDVGLVESVQSGRVRIIHLTDKGYEVCSHIKKIIELLDRG
ncbi:helix-turn-helix domain-containing protein [Geoglobus acetivorans]|uniref:ArnR1-like winged helix-turn-helix domain-containing protein n=1 Tax=Geoglobus acetivorans TaxID=565033 RepID=A0A0A7GCM9_GEOAI|nr:hypothetical protein GACE_0713 [Geoglobus acetivorans]